MTPLVYTIEDLRILFAQSTPNALRKYLATLAAFPKPFTLGRWGRMDVDAWAMSQGLKPAPLFAANGNTPITRHPCHPRAGGDEGRDEVSRLEKAYAIT